MTAAGGTDRRPLGRTGLLVSPVCVGTSPLASMPRLYGYEVSAQRAEATIRAVLDSPGRGRRGGTATAPVRRDGPAGRGAQPPGWVRELETLLAVQIPGVLWAELDALTVGPELWLN